MKKLLLIGLFATTLSGCASASLVQSVHQPQKGGVVKYRNSALGGGPSEEKAKTLMLNSCLPVPYTILQKQASAETVGYNSSSTGTLNGNSYSGDTKTSAVNKEYVYIQFRCDSTPGTASTN